ncbi:hypothetical protein OSB04_011353 [Centaurea solstitialis]|uniref:Disease resistance R13L4/SHOC-2-like LRR domain-containing protein n=1 Tax=Centaurea solstitialis TaxID=347529 RepID=A0AA38T9A1_9ASTR|nr:hypothetical protein OSB04_011353 [Centaurea solstitialis]
MIWFYFTITFLSSPKTTILATSIGNQLGAVAAARGKGDVVNKCFHKQINALLHFKSVTCNKQTHHVTELNLYSYELVGEISPSLLNLTYMNYLDLSVNFFNGTISNFIGSMPQLRHLGLSGMYLNLSNNKFNGTIPNFLGSLTHLRYLDLSLNNFNGTIPKSIGSLTHLEYLDLSCNYLVGIISPEFGNLTNLRDLLLGNWYGSQSVLEIENLDWLSNLSHLQNLQIHEISFAKADYWVDIIFSLPKLSTISLLGCHLSEVMYPYYSSDIFLHRKRFACRETPLRAFYSTTEEISSLFAKQQEQLKSMQKTLEDE